jgi:hypothetical protein
VTIGPAFWNRLLTFAGLFCLTASLLLLPAGVRTVRAEDGAQGSKSVNPTPSSSESDIVEPPPIAPENPATKIDEADRPGRTRGEVRPEFVPLNTRGYNYGPPPVEVAPAPVPDEPSTP